MLASYWLVASHSSRKSTACPRVCFSHGTVVVGGETFPDALITSPTLLLDVEACIPSAASSLGPSFARLRDVRPCAAQAWSDHDALCCGRRRAGPSNEGCNDRVVPVFALQVQRCPRSRAQGLRRSRIAPLKRSYLANRADGKVYAQQSGTLQGTVIAHGLPEVSAAMLGERETLDTSAPVTQTGTTLSLQPSFDEPLWVVRTNRVRRDPTRLARRKDVRHQSRERWAKTGSSRRCTPPHQETRSAK